MKHTKLAVLALSLFATSSVAKPETEGVLLNAIVGKSLADARTLLISSEDGRTLLPYLVRCALSPGDKVQGGPGDAPLVGEQALAPTWLVRPLTVPQQERVSACILALMNATGAHVQVLLASKNGYLPTQGDGDFTFREGAFYGNLFLSEPESFACTSDERVANSPSRSLRVCTEIGEAGLTKCGMESTGQCTAACSESADGAAFDQCVGQGKKRYREVLTVFLERNQ